MKSQIELPKFSEIITWGKWITIICTIIGVGSWIHNDFRASQADVRAIEARLDNQLIAQNARSDQLYSMFIDLLKEQKERK